VRKFINTLDFSLDAMKLREVYEKVTRRKNFSFEINHKSYTQQVINVTFKYAFREFNKVGKNVYVRAGYNFRDCVFQDAVCISDNKLVAIQINTEIANPVSKDILGKNFEYDDINKVYKQVDTIPILKNKADLRESLYKNGFVCDGIKYVRYKRSSGSSRVGKCLFVNEQLYDRMAKWDRCGLIVQEGQPIDLAAYESYISLPMSSSIDTLEILPENLLVIDDYDSVFKDDVIAVEEKNGVLVAGEKTVDVKNSIWDGQSLMDVSLFSKYPGKGMLLLRNRFFKSCCFNCNIQQWFQDNDITDVNQLNGFTLAQNIRDIKLITTPSSIKYVKFGKIEDWLKNIDITFSVVKYEKEPQFFNGRMVRTNYQLLNTLQMTYEEVEEFLQPSLDYIYKICADPDILRYHISYPYDEMDITPLNSKNEIVFKLLGINNKFAKTKLYYNFRNDLIRSLFDDLKDGKVLVNGNYSTLFGNGMEMLKQAIGKFHGESELKGNDICSSRFACWQTILGCRSPHITMGDVTLLHNVRNNNYSKYFNLSKEIVCINSIGENILQRLQGADFDSDSILLTDNKLLIRVAERNYNHFKVPTNLVSAKKTKRFYTPEQQADLDIKTSVNKIGEDINLSQQLNSLLWDRLKKGTPLTELQELYNDICKLSVLSGIEIDKAKKEFMVDTGKEIRKLKKKYEIIDQGKQVKPTFFKRITLNNGYALNGNIKYKHFDTTMEYIQKVVNNYSKKHIRKVPEKYEALMSIVKDPNISRQSLLQNDYYKEQRDRIIEIIKTTKANISALYVNYDLASKEDREVIRNNVAELRQECVEYINKISCSQGVMYLLLKEIENDKEVSRFMFEILFGTPNRQFFIMIKESKEDLNELIEWENGNIELYDFRFYKQKIA